VAIEGGRVVAVEPIARQPDVALGRVAVLPGLVNAHTHLELSYLHRQIPPARRFLDWIRPMLAARRNTPRPDDPAILRGVETAIAQLRATGTALVGDVSNTLVTVPLLRNADMPAHVFHELIGFGGAGADEQVRAARQAVDAAGDERVTRSLAPHAPYSVSPALFAAIRDDVDTHAPTLSTVHLGESPEEVEFISRGSGPWRDLLLELGAWNDAWRAPGCSPVEYLTRLRFLDRSVLVVHGVQLGRADLAHLVERGVTVVSCPRSNRYVGVGSPPLQEFYDSGVEVAFGTDSLASVEDLNLFSELAVARRVAPAVAPRDLLRSATLTGARALGFGDELGTIEPGKRALLLAVRMPEGVLDVEEYLVSGVGPDAVSWIETDQH
jgi:cytosine/adenosine deaminase-related metal-dependent hydrolase